MNYGKLFAWGIFYLIPGRTFVILGALASRSPKLHACAGESTTSPTSDPLYEIFVGEGGHRYYKAGAWLFIRKWFKAGVEDV